jgi:uncharacterized protein (TIGR03435 family)
MRVPACRAVVWAVCSVTTALCAQRLEFDVASVKLSPAGISFTILDRGGPDSPTPGTWSCEYYSLRDLLAKAFALDQSQISGPPWMDNQRFHISAKLAPAASPAQFREMLRNLLIDRFALEAHLESRVVNRYELAASGNSRKLRQSVPWPAAASAPTRPGLDADGFPKLGPPSAEPEILTIQGRTRMFFPGITIKELAEELAVKLARPVVDRTGLTGLYDIGLYWSEEDSGPSLKQAVGDQLGLRLTEQKGPVDYVIVQHIEKLPKEN